jgi:hypothetical protein
MLDEEGALEGWTARNSAIAIAKMVATIHHAFIPSWFTAISPFHAIIEIRWRIHLS